MLISNKSKWIVLLPIFWKKHVWFTTVTNTWIQLAKQLQLIATKFYRNRHAHYAVANHDGYNIEEYSHKLSVIVAMVANWSRPSISVFNGCDSVVPGIMQLNAVPY